VYSGTRVRLAQLTNQFSDDNNLAHYIQEAGYILGLDADLDDSVMDGDLAKQFLYQMGKKVSSMCDQCLLVPI